MLSMFCHFIYITDISFSLFQPCSDVAQKMDEMAGDGTTIATPHPKLAAINRVIEFLSFHAKKITTTAEIVQVATICTNGDVIAQAWKRLERRV